MNRSDTSATRASLSFSEDRPDGNFSSFQTTRSSDGVTRVENYVPPQEAVQTTYQTATVHRGAYRASADGSVQSLGSTSYQHNSNAPTTSVAATLRRDGASQTVALDPNNPGMRTDVRTAQRLGLIERADDGTWRDTAGRQGVTNALYQTRSESANSNLQTVSHAGHLGGSIATTLSRAGASLSVELVPGNPSSRTDARIAVSLGLIEPDGQGGFRDTAKAQAQAQEQAAQAQTQQATEEAASTGDYDPTTVEAWNEAAGQLPSHAHDTAVFRGIEVAATGQGLDNMVQALAKDGNMSAEDAADFVSYGAAMHQAAADKALSRIGLQGEDLKAAYAWMRSAEPGLLRHAVQQLVLAGDSSVFRQLGMSYQGKRFGR